MLIHPDRLFPSEPSARAIARELYQTVNDLPIVSPHGHTDPRWFASNDNFTNATALLLIPDHYVFRMLMSQGYSLDQLGINSRDGSEVSQDYRAIWKIFAKNYHVFRGTPSHLWMDYVFANVFGFTDTLCSDNADYYYEQINRQLSEEAFKPRQLMDTFNIEIIATTEGALDDLKHHHVLKESGFGERVVTTFRPDDVVDPDREDFFDNIETLATLTGQDTQTWEGYLEALRIRRAFFRDHGATATDHGHPSARTADLSKTDCEALFAKCLSRSQSLEDSDLFRGQMLTEMAGMSVEDGMVMQIHPGCYRNHNTSIFTRFGADKGGDIPLATDYVHSLRPLLNKYGNETRLTIIVFTLDETSYSRELAPLAGHYPAMKVGPAWWFHDSPEGMLRYRQQITETAGFYNTVGFNDDTRAFLSIPARHDVARRMDCRFLGSMVAEHRLNIEDAQSLAQDLSYNLAKQAYFGA